jgi:Putative beta-barrel porin-2, OmpL-like. bbp2
MRKESDMKGLDSTMKIGTKFTARISLSILVLAMGWIGISGGKAEAQSVQPQRLFAEAPAVPGDSAAPSPAASAKPSATNATTEVLKELEQMRARIAELEAQLKAQQGGAPAVVNAALTNGQPATAESSSLAKPALHESTQQEAKATQKPEPAVPFAYADWTWLNGNARNKDAVWDSKFFTPEIRFDANYISSFNHPQDDTLGGSTETFRSNEVQIEQISFGGDLHWENVRARILTMGGMFAVTTPRNDASPGRGQWDLRGAYKYFSEANAGYHFNVNHGLNVDAGIFVSYIGLFSYYNFDNWAYQPSYVSSNTPWFFNGVRIQWFPTDKLKIEPWIINGWQSYGRLGSKPGLGGQILWRPKPWLSIVSNNYGMGEDTLGNGNGQFGRSRIHTDNSVEVKYYDRPEKFLDKMAFSLTGDLGCEYGGKGTATGAQGQTVILNTNCFHDTPNSRKQTFAGWMAYNRFWFKKDIYALTVGGGAMDNPGRYLTLLPPINGADAITGSPYFTQNPGDPYKAWDASLTFDWMPRQYITFRTEYGYRHANVPYWSGRGGITPGDNTLTSTVPNPNAGSIVPGTLFVPGSFLSPTPGSRCVAGTGFCPDLRNDEAAMRFAIMVKF